MRFLNRLTKVRRIAAFTLAAVTVAAMALVPASQVQAEDYWPTGVDVQAGSAIVMDVDTGTILYSKNIDQQYYPASITKVMTALITLENCDLDEMVTFSADAVYKNENGTSSIARDINEEMTVEQTLYGMMLESANECAWALGEHVAGDMDSFVDMMNERAKELGCTNTHFNNPNGLPDEEHLTTAHDMALISAAAYKIPKFAEIVGTKSYTIPPTNKHSDPTPLNNHHCMLHYYKTNKYLYEYCLGGKTGYTEVAGATLVTYAKKDDMTLVCVVMRDSSGQQYIDTTNLFNYCFDNFTIYSISDFASISEEDTNVTGLLSESNQLIKIDGDGKVILPKTASVLDAKTSVIPYTDDNDASIVGQIHYSYADREVGSANLVFTSKEALSYPFDNISVDEGGSGKEYIQIDYMKIALVLAVIIILIVVAVIIHRKSGKLLLFKHRFAERHPKKAKPRFTVIKRRKNHHFKRK